MNVFCLAIIYFKKYIVCCCFKLSVTAFVTVGNSDMSYPRVNYCGFIYRYQEVQVPVLAVGDTTSKIVFVFEFVYFTDE